MTAADDTPRLEIGELRYHPGVGVGSCSWLSGGTRRGAGRPGSACSLCTRNGSIATPACLFSSLRNGAKVATDARPDDPGSGDAAAYGLDGCLDAVVEVEFREDAGDVVVDGVGAERELVRDLAIGSAAGEPFEDL